MNLIVVGLGYVGLPVAIHAAEAGYKVLAYDTNLEKIIKLQQGITEIPDLTCQQIDKLQSNGQINFVSTLEKQKEKSIIVIAVPTPLDSDKAPDLTMLKQACESIAKVVVDDCLIITESTSYIGTLRNLIKPIIDSESKINTLKYAVAPERIDPGNKKWFIKNTPRLISGITDEAKKEAIVFYGHFCDEIHQVSTPEVAEAAKLFENSFRQVNIALVNEFTQIAEKLNFSTHEAIMAAATKPFGFMPFYPSIGVGGHCIPVDPSYLSYSAEIAGVDAKFIKLANQVNSSMPNVVKERIKYYLGGDLNGKQVQIAGISYKPDISDLRESPALDLIKELEMAGAIVCWHDPFVDEYNGKKSVALSSEIDLGLIVTPHSQIDFSIWQKTNIEVLDLSANSNNYGWPKFL
jgi:UDP-N-acetyl-D-glucosamine dehydrogenase